MPDAQCLMPSKKKKPSVNTEGFFFLDDLLVFST
jgi:hypothetical protein